MVQSTYHREYYLRHRDEILKKRKLRREERIRELLGKIKEIEIPEADKAYIAGLFDGEGYFGVTKRSDSPNLLYRPLIAVVNTDAEVLNWCKTRLNCGFITKPRKRKGWRNCYEFRIVNLIHVGCVCLTLLPFLRVKKKQAGLVLEFVRLRLKNRTKVIKDSRGRFVKVIGKEHSPEELKIIQKLKQLNIRGN